MLIAGGEPGTLNHLGVEVASAGEVAAAVTRVADEGMDHAVQNATECCYALQDKVWVHGPDTAWEIHTVLADAPNLGPADGTCCA